MRDKLGVSKAPIAGTLILRLGNYRYAVRVGIPVRPDCHHLACYVDQPVTAGDIAECHQAPVAKLRCGVPLPAWGVNVSVVSLECLHHVSPAVEGRYRKSGPWLVAMASDNMSR